MYATDRVRRHTLPVLTVLTLALFVMPVCGTWLPPQRHLRPIAKSSLPVRLKGLGLNCHFEELPVQDMKAIGVQWVRIDLGGGGLHADSVRHIVDHYRDFGILWIVSDGDHDPIAEARLVAGLGVADLEILNEPDIQPAAKSPSAYARLFGRVRTAVGDRVRLWGPSLSTWAEAKPYLDAVLDQGAQMDGISFHPYLRGSQQIEDMAPWVREALSYGLPAIASEIGYSTTDNSRAIYGKGSSIGQMFARTQRALAGIPWCWYDGPNPADNGDAGIFDKVPRVGYVPNHNYRDIKAAIG